MHGKGSSRFNVSTTTSIRDGEHLTTICIAFDKTACRFHTGSSSSSSDLRGERSRHSLSDAATLGQETTRLWHMQKMHACAECSQKANPAVAHGRRRPCVTLITCYVHV